MSATMTLVVGNAPAPVPDTDTLVLTTAAAMTWPERARAIQVVDEATYRQAGETLVAIRVLRKRIGQFLDPRIDDAKEMKRVADAKRGALVAEKSAIEKPLIEAEDILKRSCADYADLAEEARLAEEATAREAADAVEAANRQASADAIAALTTELGPDVVTADVVAALETPTIAVADVHVESRTPTIEGLSFTERWHAEITDLPALLRALADGALTPELAADLTLRITKAVLPPLNDLAVGLKALMNVPGVTPRSTKSTSISTKGLS